MKHLATAVLCMLLVNTVLAMANSAPTGDHINTMTWQGKTVEITVVVNDGDIDPLSPESHPISFSIQEAPLHGVVAGDLDRVLYVSPSSAILALSYTPASGFTGNDQFLVRAEEVAGEAIVLRVSIEVRVRGSTASLTGSNLMTTTIDVQTGSVTSTNISGTVRYSVYATSVEAGYLFKRQALDVDEIFDDLYFTMNSPFGGFASINGRLDFNPETTSDLFDYASLSMTMRSNLATLSSTIRTDGTQTGSSLVLALSGQAIEGLSFSARATFEPCLSTFLDATASLRFRTLDCGSVGCGITVSGSASFSNSGFERLTISASDVEFPDVGWLGLVSSASVTITYDLQAKSLALSPQFVIPWVDCIRFGVVVDWVDNGASNLHFTSAHLDRTFANGIRVRMHTSLDPWDLTSNQSVTGHLDYWEKDVISGDFESCFAGGISGNWQVAVYFARPGVGTSLFNWGMLELEADVFCARKWRFFTELTFRSGDFGGSTCELLLGAEFHW